MHRRAHRTLCRRRPFTPLGRFALAEISPTVLARALEPFPGPSNLRTLDALHLSTCVHLQERIKNIKLASYDRRMNNTARALGIPLYDFKGSEMAKPTG